jgi:hypothetical protein
MQRAPMDDLTGFVQEQSDKLTVLIRPAIAEVDEVIQFGANQNHHRILGTFFRLNASPSKCSNKCEPS